MNTRKEYPTFEEIRLVVHKKNQELAQKRNPKRNMMIKLSQQSSRISGIRRSLAQGRNQIKKRMSKIQCFNCRKYGHYMNHYPELKKRKETNEATISKEREPSKKDKQDKTNFFF